MMKKYKNYQSITRTQSSQIKGGVLAIDDDSDPSGSGAKYLKCWTPGGFEQWRRRVCPADPDIACQKIYPAYNGGVWGMCCE
jgi:hypothetical protein